jgi:hypothetical protein
MNFHPKFASNRLNTYGWRRESSASDAHMDDKAHGNDHSRCPLPQGHTTYALHRSQM